MPTAAIPVEAHRHMHPLSPQYVAASRSTAAGADQNAEMFTFKFTAPKEGKVICQHAYLADAVTFFFYMV